jgi:hypothetical protein
MNTAKFLIGAAAAVTFALGTSEASADYVCNTFLLPGASVAGNDGYVLTQLYSAPNCGGGYVSTRYFCSAGATATWCASNPGYRYDAAKLVAVFSALQRAAIHDELVSVLTSACIGGGSGCASVAQFSSN